MWREQLYVTQPCLHTLMQTRLSANQSARTIFVILQITLIELHLDNSQGRMQLTHA